MPGRISSPYLVGRSAELATVASVLDTVAGGLATPLLISGEAGVGKTRLVEELMRLATERGMRVLHGGCINLGESGVPYDPIVDALRGLVRDLDPETLAAVVADPESDLVRLVPSLSPGRTARDSTPSEWLQARLFEGLLGLLQHLAAISPTVLVLEDLHWSDPATREAATFLVRSLSVEPVLLAMTFRSDELHRRHPLLPWLAELERTGRVERLELRRLGPQATRELVAAIGGAEPGDDRLERIFRRSDGNPFFVEELLAAEGEAAGSERLPTTLREVLLARIAAVPEAAQTILGVAAVIGDRMDHELLGAVAGWPEPALLAALRSAAASLLLVPETVDGTRDGYAFRHALVREAAYDDLLPGERRRLHRSCANALAARPPGAGGDAAAAWAALAHHWSAAGDDVRAFDSSLRAATAAEEAFAFAAAHRQYERALELWSSVPDPEAIGGVDRVTVLGRAAQAAFLIGNPRRDVVLRREAVAAVDAAGDPVRSAILHEQLGRALWQFGDSVGALAAYETSVALMPAEPPTAERARVMAGLGQMLMLLDRWTESARLCEEAISIARRVGAPIPEGHALNTLGLDLAAHGRCAEAVDAIDRSRAIALEARHVDDVGRAYANLIDVQFFCGDATGAARTVDDGVEVAEQFGVARSWGSVIRHTGVLPNFELGRWDVAARLATEGFALSGADDRVDRYGLAHWVALLVATGSAAAQDKIDRLGELIREGPVETQWSGPYYAAKAEQALWQGHPADALATVERGLADLGDKTWFWYLLRLHRVGARAAADLAEVARARRDAALEQEARSRGAALTIARGLMVETDLAIRSGPTADETRAVEATAAAEETRLRGEPNPAAWRDVAERWQALARPYALAYARWRAGEAALAVGDRPMATGVLSEAASIAGRLGARPLLDAVTSLAARGRVRLTAATPEPTPGVPPAAADPFGLTARELDVLALVALGRTNRQIADELFISENTAGVHVSHILGKLGASGRAEAAAIAVRLGLADVS